MEIGNRRSRSIGKDLLGVTSNTSIGGRTAKRSMAIAALIDVRMEPTQVAGCSEHLRIRVHFPSQPREKHRGGDTHILDGTAWQRSKSHLYPAKIPGTDDMERNQDQEHDNHRGMNYLPYPEGFLARCQTIEPFFDLVRKKPPAPVAPCGYPSANVPRFDAPPVR